MAYNYAFLLGEPSLAPSPGRLPGRATDETPGQFEDSLMKASARISLLTLLNMVVWACGVPLGHAAPTIALSPDSRVDLRSAYATTQELAEGKQLAEASCARCHGLNGISTTEGVPHIAGQRPAYLHFEMRVYQSGGRDNKPMTDAVKFLSDDALMKVAAYYGSLDPAPVT